LFTHSQFSFDCRCRGWRIRGSSRSAATTTGPRRWCCT
jgi:hypothetical protein